MVKRIFSLILSLVFVLSVCTLAYASDRSSHNEALHVAPYKEFSVKDVKRLEPYIYIDNGHYAIDTYEAINAGFDLHLIEYQQTAFDYINAKADAKEIQINNDLSFTTVVVESHKTHHQFDNKAGHWYNCGGGRNTSTTNYWWGYARYACDCETNRMVADFNSCASVAAGAGVLGSYFGFVGALPGGLSSAYWWLLASRLDANNHGRGVYVEMTWILAFDITPQ
ncbi:MAG: hypothetical protein IKX16_04225 [Clostridia bacterium]|jgi:hypothetical protein|nr:hypothetical protein [Clostridia bacterium]